MKYLFFLLFGLFTLQVSAQEAHKWINFPYSSSISIIKEARVRDYLLLDGKVKEIKMTSAFTGDDERNEIHVSYSQSGNILSYQKTHFDPESAGGISTFVSMNFEYNESNSRSSESKLTIIEGDTMEQIDSRWPEWFPHLTIPTNSIYTEKVSCHPIYRDTTYSFYDEYNRKIMDSIPAPRKGDAKMITYEYVGNKVYRKFYFLEEDAELYEKEEYTLDDHGNWVERKYYGMFNLNSDQCTELSTREISYF